MTHLRLTRRGRLRTGLATTAALGAAALPRLGWAHPASGPHRTTASGQVIRAWNETACAQPFGTGVRLSRILAIMHAAQHDAVNGADPQYEPYAATLSDPTADAEAAAAAAAHTVLLAFFPTNQAALDAQLATSLAGILAGAARTAGVALGRAVGQRLLNLRANDGFAVPDPFTPPPGPGVWEPTPPAFAPMVEPQFQNVRPFTLNDRTQFLPEPPPALSSAAYAEAFNEVKLIGQDTSAARTADQTHLAHFWAEPSPMGWSRLGTIVAAQQGYGLHRTARLLALLNMAMADGFIVGWYQKRYFAFWRPVTAIRKAESDGNAATSPDPSWLPLRATPALPDYPSTHSLLGSAAAEVLRRFTGLDEVSLCMGSTTATPAGTQRCWTSVTQAELENAESRVLVGFHFRFACETGVKVGRKVGKFAIGHALRALHDRD